MLATAGSLPTGPGWCAEAKWDGVRTVAYLEGGTVGLLGRRGTDYTERFPEVTEALAGVRGPLVLDGELVVMRAGLPSFTALQSRVHRSRPAAVQAAARADPAMFVAFDLLHTDRPLLAEPYGQRRALWRASAWSSRGCGCRRPGTRWPRRTRGPGSTGWRA
ncbi:hypothetical protein ACFQ0M_47680 [Kitasatospora aburaviensis]